MKQVYLTPQGRWPRGELRSDTLFGWIAIAIREVCGREVLERFLEPLRRDPPEAPLRITSAFPFAEGEAGRVHHSPAPLTGAGEAEARSESGRRPASAAAAQPRTGLFFLAEGPGESYLEAALGYLERAGFGSGASTGGGAYRIEMREAEFLRTARPGEMGLLLSLYLPTDAERVAIAAAARRGEDVAYALCRRRGIAGRGRFQGDRPYKRAVTMMTEGSVLPVGSASPGCAPVVAELHDGDASFGVVQHGFGFFVPLSGGEP